MRKDKEALEDSQMRVDTAKALLKQMDPEEQQRIMVSDTKLPELLALHTKAKEDYETSLKRYETNKKYLKMCQEKMGAATSEES